MWLLAVAAQAGEPLIHPTTGEPHRLARADALTFEEVAQPSYPPEALGDPSVPDPVRCTARLWSRADGTVETVELLACPPAFGPPAEAVLARYRFHDARAAAPAPLVTEVVVEFARPGEEVPSATLIHPVSRASVPVLERPEVLRRKLPPVASDTPVTCTATLFVTPAGRVETVSVRSECPWPKPVVRAAMRWRFEPWAPGGTPTAFAVIAPFDIDP